MTEKPKDTMLASLKRALSRYRTEDHEGIHTPQHEDAMFVLHYDELFIGTLRLHEGVWEFSYSREFQQQTQVKPLVDFPDPEKTYRSDSLWPFFLARIPSLSQPRIQDLVEQEGLDQGSDVQLLRRFGQRSISNPFVLTTVDGSDTF